MRWGIAPYFIVDDVVATAAGAVSAWAAESTDYDYASNTCSGVCGHYTQVVWAATTQVGCGIAEAPCRSGNESFFSAPRLRRIPLGCPSKDNRCLLP